MGEGVAGEVGGELEVWEGVLLKMVCGRGEVRCEGVGVTKVLFN